MTPSSAGAASASAPRGCLRDPVRSSHGHFVKASGLRWLSLMLLVPIPWAGRVWALPFLTALAPSERYCRERKLRHKKLTDWGRQLVLQARRWMPGRRLVLVTDSGSLPRSWLPCCGRSALRYPAGLDAALYQAPPRQPGAVGRPRTKGEHLPTLAEVLANKTTRWQRVTVPGWLARATASWRSARTPPFGAQRPASRADPLGAAARSLPALRSAGPALHRPSTLQ